MSKTTKAELSQFVKELAIHERLLNRCRIEIELAKAQLLEWYELQEIRALREVLKDHGVTLSKISRRNHVHTR